MQIAASTPLFDQISSRFAESTVAPSISAEQQQATEDNSWAEIQAVLQLHI